MRPSSCCSRRATQPSRRGGSPPRPVLKPQLVHYYFRTMDDLFLEVFAGGRTRTWHFERAIATDCSLRTLWRLNADPRGAAFMHRVRRAGQPPQGHPYRDRRYAERFARRPARGLTAALGRRSCR
jgi:hypothetical protein